MTRGKGLASISKREMNMTEIYHIEDLDEHTVSELICVKCGKRWIGVRPTSCLLKHLECPECGLDGYVIETGQELFDEDGEYIKG